MPLDEFVAEDLRCVEVIGDCDLAVEALNSSGPQERGSRACAAGCEPGVPGVHERAVKQRRRSFGRRLARASATGEPGRESF
ncbi:hypothetical protein [Streptomyces sp. NBC_00316]|uniref:hypothetical protein n=1 Tax=Streptomyces sp. NBC_00316 TaxID=2975710 RepID=UPI002E27EE33|nr:hypothetical protein [Streptomyces sp. NBC_00316]